MDTNNYLVPTLLIIIFLGVPTLLTVLNGVFKIINIINTKKNTNFIKAVSKGKFNSEINYFRDIPCDKDIFYAFFLAVSYQIVQKGTNFIGCILLYWIKNGYIIIQPATDSENISLELNKHLFYQNYTIESLESRLFNYIYEASINGILDSKEFEKFCQSNYTYILDWFKKIQAREKMKCIYQKLLVKRNGSFVKYLETEKLYKDACELYGLKRFLEDFSSIEDKNAIEVHLWEYYLIYAQLFGIADRVAAEFKHLYPSQISNLLYDDYMFISNMSNEINNYFNTEISKNDEGHSDNETKFFS